MADPQKKVAVIVPLYRESLTSYENIALLQCNKVLSEHPIIAVKPLSLDISSLNSTFNFTDVVSFDDAYFTDIQGYNRLMLSTDFYKAFLSYEFILIHQLDAFVFRDDLLSWCNGGYDYIGAPWIRPIDYTDFIKAIKSKTLAYLHTRFNTLKNGLPSPAQFENKVGNGGFSLRRVQKFHDLSISLASQINRYHESDAHQFHEDAFWSVEVNRKKAILKMPSWKKALLFSFENWPERSLRITGGQLPFGCHAWDDYPEFWRPYFQQSGYEI